MSESRTTSNELDWFIRPREIAAITGASLGHQTEQEGPRRLA